MKTSKDSHLIDSIAFVKYGRHFQWQTILDERAALCAPALAPGSAHYSRFGLTLVCGHIFLNVPLSSCQISHREKNNKKNTNYRNFEFFTYKVLTSKKFVSFSFLLFFFFFEEEERRRGWGRAVHNHSPKKKLLKNLKNYASMDK